MSSAAPSNPASASSTAPSTSTSSSSPDPVSVQVSAKHAEATTAPIAAAAHTTLVNALTTPTVATIHDHSKSSQDVVISNLADFERKVAAMVKDGAEKLQIIADFDRTISAFLTKSGQMCAASHNLLESCVGFDQSTFRPAMDAINAKYFALEISHDITEEERAAHMMDWWNQAHDLLLKQGIHYHAIEKAVQLARETGQLELRRGAREMLHQCEKANIPCLIFSAGLQETIRVTLKQEQLLDLSNLYLIGNEMIFDEKDGKLLKFGEDVITSSNKNYTHVRTQQPQFHSQNVSRRNVILMGDNIGDSQMAAGMEDINQIIKIGLLHDNVDSRMQQFKDKFDVVLLNDADCSFVQRIIQDIINKNVEKKYE